MSTNLNSGCELELPGNRMMIFPHKFNLCPRTRDILGLHPEIQLEKAELVAARNFVLGYDLERTQGFQGATALDLVADSGRGFMSVTAFVCGRCFLRTVGKYYVGSRSVCRSEYLEILSIFYDDNQSDYNAGPNWDFDSMRYAEAIHDFQVDDIQLFKSARSMYDSMKAWSAPLVQRVPGQGPVIRAGSEERSDCEPATPGTASGDLNTRCFWEIASVARSLAQEDRPHSEAYTRRYLARRQCIALNRHTRSGNVQKILKEARGGDQFIGHRRL